MIAVTWFFAILIMVFIYAIVTSIVNNKPQCNHIWDDLGEGVQKCSKCNKTIHLGHSYEKAI